MLRNLIRLIMGEQCQQRGRKSIGAELNSCPQCYSYNCYSHEDRSLRCRHVDARSGGTQPVERGFPRIPATLSAYPGCGARIGCDEPQSAGRLDRHLETVGAERARASHRAPAYPTAKVASHGGAGLYGFDAVGPQSEDVVVTPTVAWCQCHSPPLSGPDRTTGK